MSKEEKEFKELLISAISSIAEVTKTKDVGIVGPIEIELAVVTKKTANGKMKLFLVEAGADYEKEKLSRIKFSLGSKQGAFKNLTWTIPN